MVHRFSFPVNVVFKGYCLSKGFQINPINFTPAFIFRNNESKILKVGYIKKNYKNRMEERFRHEN